MRPGFSPIISAAAVLFVVVGCRTRAPEATTIRVDTVTIVTRSRTDTVRVPGVTVRAFLPCPETPDLGFRNRLQSPGAAGSANGRVNTRFTGVGWQIDVVCDSLIRVVQARDSVITTLRSNERTVHLPGRIEYRTRGVDYFFRYAFGLTMLIGVAWFGWRRLKIPIK